MNVMTYEFAYNLHTMKSIKLFKQNNISHINLCNWSIKNLQKTFIVDLIIDYIIPDSFVIFLIICFYKTIEKNNIFLNTIFTIFCPYLIILNISY